MLLIEHFVLTPEGTSPHACASRFAMRAYADYIEATDKSLAYDLAYWVKRELRILEELDEKENK